MMVIALHGKAGAGKNKAAEIMQSFLPKGTTGSTAFARAMKDVAKIKFGLTEHQVDTQEGKKEYIPELGKTVRELLELEGTEATRMIYGDDFWIWRMAQTLKQFHKGGKQVVFITDVRFPNEAEYVKSNGGVVIEIDRDMEEALATTTHASAQPLPRELVDIVIDNNGSIEDLTNTLKELVEVLEENYRA